MFLVGIKNYMHCCILEKYKKHTNPDCYADLCINASFYFAYFPNIFAVILSVCVFSNGIWFSIKEWQHFSFFACNATILVHVFNIELL